MYFPYFRGKQYELMTIRETAKLLSEAGFTPIIEPVRAVLTGLNRAIQAICDADGSAILVVNPRYGDLAYNQSTISEFLEESFGGARNISAGILLHENCTVNDAIELCERHGERDLTLVHDGMPNATELAAEMARRRIQVARQVFIGERRRRSRRNFVDGDAVIVVDGFEKRKNRDHPDLEFFSDLHNSHADLRMEGFGDFLIAGDDYSESGGPAYAVAIHLTFIDDEDEDDMFIYHFKSIRQDTPTDPAGKFAEALQRMIEVLNAPGCKVYDTEAVQEFRALHERGHFPGLGYVKKLSMKHHIETIAQFFAMER